MKGDDIAARFEVLAAGVVALVRRLPQDRAGRVMEHIAIGVAIGVLLR